MVTRFLCIALLAISFIACGDSASNEVLKKIKSSYETDGQKVELIGYISLNKSQIIRGDEITVGLDNVAGQSDGELATIKLKFGQEPNRIYIPENYKSSDLEIYDNGGNKYNYLTKVKITGIVKYTNKDWKDFIDKEIKGSESIKPNDPARGMKLQSINNQIKSKQEAKEEADKREAETGDPNDYSFYIIGQKIEVE